MRAVVLKEKGGLYFTNVPRPEPKPDEVLLHVLVCGVCTSDMGAWRNGLGKETILGHEVVGIVVKTGCDVTGFETGERVTGSIQCGYAEYCVAKASGLLKVPDSLMDHEAIVEPFVCLLSGIERLGPALGKSAAVIGAGYMGLGLIKLLQLHGVQDITAIDAQSPALDNAAGMGAVQCLHSSGTAGHEFPVVFESAGAASALDSAGMLCTRYGTLVIVGYHPCRREIDLAIWASKALTVINAFEYRKQKQLLYMQQALAMAAERQLPTGRLLTHVFSFEKIEDAFKAHEQKIDGYLKSYIRITER